MRVHLDTDFAGNPDDAGALAMLLGWPDVEVSGITTVADPDGRRAAYVSRFLAMAGRTDIRVAAGAPSSLTGQPMGEIADHDRYWDGTPPAGGPVDDEAAVDLLGESVDRGAHVVAIGPYTNLARLLHRRPDGLDDVPVTVMGGCLERTSSAAAPVETLPPWGPDRDSNILWDVRAALVLSDSGADLTLVTLLGAAGAQLCAAHLTALGSTGSLGRLLARQARAHGEDRRYGELAKQYPGLADDLVSFHWDPVACAAALGWDGVTVEDLPLSAVERDGALRFVVDDAGRRTRVVTGVDGAAFTDRWLAGVAAAQR